MKIEIDENKLSSGQRRFLRDLIAVAAPSAPILERPPESYRQALDEVFGSCAEDGDLSRRGS
jgi:hypothetical protein